MQTKKDTPNTRDLRDRLKALMDRELDRLPELLDALDGKKAYRKGHTCRSMVVRISKGSTLYSDLVKQKKIHRTHVIFGTG